ncbi:MAG: 4-hydroxyphenylacetate 3-monooxygenase, oxygenase component [Solibacillus sp.]
MGILTGEQFIRRLDSLKNNIWYDGEQVTIPLSQHPAFQGILKTKAALYDLQHDEQLQQELTFHSPVINETVGTSFLQPRTKEELVQRRVMTRHWAKQTNGMVGRTPDYLNTVLMSLACSGELLERIDTSFPQHLQSLYQLAMKEDLSFTHTFITPQVNRSRFYVDHGDKPISAKITDITDEGLVIKGARLLATQGGSTDEVLVLSVPQLLLDPNEAFAFSIPSNTKGLTFICRDSYVGGDSFFNHPLSSRYEEMDAIVVFNDVTVPWQRVFYYHNTELAKTFLAQSSFSNFATHQALTRQIAKTEFLLGLAELLVKTINVHEYQHIHEKMADIITGLETMKALIEKSEHDATLDSFGYMRPHIIPLKVAMNLFPKIYPRFVEILQQIGASGMISLPSEQAFHSQIAPELEHYLQGAAVSADARVKIFRLAWDATMSAFGTRQTQYERFFYGDPVRLAGDLYQTYPKEDAVESVRKFLNLDE